MRLEPLTRSYEATPIGWDNWVRPDPGQTLEEFQLIVATAEAWEVMRNIRILEIREDNYTGRRFINAVRFQRLR
jgi:hypothetical protein